MLAIVKSLALSGMEGHFIQVEVDVANGLPFSRGSSREQILAF
jgi:hypothetical protein